MILENLTPLQQWIIYQLATCGGMCRKDLVEATNYPRTTLYDNLAKLKNKKLVSSSRKYKPEKGRPFVIWGLTDYCYDLLREGEIDE